MKKLFHLVAPLGLIGLVMFGAVWFYNHRQPAKASAQTTTSVQTTVAHPVNVNATSFGATLTGIINQNPDLDISISLTDLQTGAHYHYGETAGYDAASMIKLVTATDFLHEVEAGNMSLDADYGGDTGQNQLQKMIVDSDNDAWAAMEDALTLDSQQSYAASIGLTSYVASDNIITSDDINLLLQKLSEHQLLNASDTSLLLSYMQQANYRDYIVAAIPSGTQVYHKVGLLDDRLLDAAIIKRGDRSYILAIFSKDDSGTYDFSNGATLFGNISRATLQAFFGKS